MPSAPKLLPKGQTRSDAGNLSRLLAVQEQKVLSKISMEVEQKARLTLANGQMMRKTQPLDLEGATNPLDCLKFQQLAESELACCSGGVHFH